MKSSKATVPPKWPRLFLRWYCKPELAEDLEGDLHEYFVRNVRARGVIIAKLIYVIDVIKFCRGYTIRKPNLYSFLIQWIMINSYLKLTTRIIIRNKLFSFINIMGLGISMAVGLLLISLITDMKAYDKFHVNHDRIYRVISTFNVPGQDNPGYFASTSLRAGKFIQESIPGIEETALIYREFHADMSAGQKTTPLSGFWASEDFFKVFSFAMVSGDPARALKEPYSIILTESAARKLFGDDDALGKSVLQRAKNGDREYIVTGVVKEVSRFSHLKFDMLASLSTREITEKDNKHEMAWSNMWNAYVYLLLPEDPDLETLKSNLNALAANENKTEKNFSVKLSVQPLNDIALGEDLNNSFAFVMETKHVWMIGVLSCIVLLSACFNYTNLSLARALKRSREVGIRKVVGALRRDIVSQFVIEAVVIALIALAISLLLFIFVKPYFLSLNDRYHTLLALDLSPKLILFFVLLAVTVGIAAGFMPAIFFARVNAIQVLKNISKVRVFRNVTIRKVLIVTQFTISLMFIAATIIGYKHYKNILAFNLGFDTENVLNIRLFGNKAEVFKKALLDLPEVKQVSTSILITNLGNYWGTHVKYQDSHDSASVYYNIVDEQYIPLHGHQLLVGRNFEPQGENATESEVIVNEQLLKRFNIGNQNPASAIGEIVTVDGKKLQIIGVMKDFYYGRSTDKLTKEVMFRYAPSKAEYVNVKVISSDLIETLAKIDKAWRKIDNVHPLEASFYDEQIEHSYREFSSRIKVIGSLAFLAICISSIGLLGMVVFTTETRLKEISIRKVLGASETSLVLLLTKGFILLLGIAAIIALPTAHFFLVKYVLEGYADNMPIAWSELFISSIVVIVVAFILIGTHTLQAARSNPANVLKIE